MDVKRFQDKVAIIAGASSGIGRATAEIMAREGAVVFLVGRDAARLDEAIRSINSSGGRAFGAPGDATKPEVAQAAVTMAERESGRVDILINCVGGSTIVANPAAPIDELDFNDWQRLLAFNLDATFHFCHLVAPIMRGGARDYDAAAEFLTRIGT